MPPWRWLFAGVIVMALVPVAQAQEAPSSQPPRIVRDIRVIGAKELPLPEIVAAAHARVGEALGPLVDLERSVERRYHDEGYTFARVKAAFDDQTLILTIDEGVIDRVEFEGIGESAARTFVRDFALRAGDVFNRARATEALEALLQPTRGAIRPARRRGAFNLVDENGQRVLKVGLHEPAGRFHLGSDDREDWFTPVDGFVPSLGFGAVVFDHQQFNHTFVTGRVSYRVASETVGYALGFERPLFTQGRLYVGGEIHDLTATDDWQVSPLEASLAAIGPRRSFRDYYRRRGVQVSGAWRAARSLELVFAWRSERQEPLRVQTEFSLWNDDEAFRPNLAARDGRLSAILVGASLDRGLGRESLEAIYRRHQLDAPFGGRLRDLDEANGRAVWRADWTSEISTPDALGSDFDFSRHIVSTRARVALTRHQDFGVRAIGGWSGGALPPQREFAIGGIGTVHGYAFKEAVGDSGRKS